MGIIEITPENESAIIERGAAMDRALTDDHLSLLFEDVMRAGYERFIDTKREDASEREALYFEAQAVIAIRQKMQHYRQLGIDAKKARESRIAEEERTRPRKAPATKPIAG